MNEINKEEPLLEVQPVVIPIQFFVFGPLASAILSLFPGVLIFIISNIIARSSDPVIHYGLIAYLLSFTGIMYLIYLKCYHEPRETTYRIFDNKLEFYEGFLSRQQRTVVFDQVIDVLLTESIFQQTKSAGSVTLITQQLVSSGEGRMSNRRVVLSNVPKPQEVYELVRDLAINNKESVNN